MSAEDRTQESHKQRRKLEGIIKPGTVLIIDFEFENGDKTRRVVEVPKKNREPSKTND